jgi:hypothetical protein
MATSERPRIHMNHKRVDSASEAQLDSRIHRLRCPDGKRVDSASEARLGSRLHKLRYRNGTRSDIVANVQPGTDDRRIRRPPALGSTRCWVELWLRWVMQMQAALQSDRFPRQSQRSPLTSSASQLLLVYSAQTKRPTPRQSGTCSWGVMRSGAEITMTAAPGQARLHISKNRRHLCAGVPFRGGQSSRPWSK